MSSASDAKRTVTILGCGSSGGVPRIGGIWGDCDPGNPKNRRRRCSILLQQHSEKGTTRVLVDTPPDLRMQLLDARVGEVDAVLYTHEHADHTHGIDDLRQIAFNRKERTDVFMAEHILEHMTSKFSYCFKCPPKSLYKPILNARTFSIYEPLTITGQGGEITALPMQQQHGSILSMGFRFGEFTYSTDVSEFPPEPVEAMRGTRIWVIDALRHKSHKTHFKVKTALEWIEEIKPERAYLTNMHYDLDYAALCAYLPPHVRPAHDGLRLDV